LNSLINPLNSLIRNSLNPSGLTDIANYQCRIPNDDPAMQIA